MTLVLPWTSLLNPAMDSECTCPAMGIEATNLLCTGVMAIQ